MSPIFVSLFLIINPSKFCMNSKLTPCLWNEFNTICGQCRFWRCPHFLIFFKKLLDKSECGMYTNQVLSEVHMDDQLSWLEHPLDVRKVIGSSPISSTIYEKSELLHERKCVRIFYLYQRHFILMLKPRGFHRPLGFLTFLARVLGLQEEIVNSVEVRYNIARKYNKIWRKINGTRRT